MLKHNVEAAEAGAAALEREADAEEKAKPQFPLEIMAEHVSKTARGWACGNNPCKCCRAAADTLRRLREEGPQFASAVHLRCFHADLVEWLRSLGVELKP